MAEYNKDVDWDGKERRIVKQSMAKAILSCPHWKLVDADGEPDLDSVLELADKCVDWVYETKSVATTVVPTPTASQAKALEKVEKETGWNKEQVYTRFNKYPDESTVDKCIAVIRKEL